MANRQGGIPRKHMAKLLTLGMKSVWIGTLILALLVMGLFFMGERTYILHQTAFQCSSAEETILRYCQSDGTPIRRGRIRLVLNPNAEGLGGITRALSEAALESAVARNFVSYMWVRGGRAVRWRDYEDGVLTRDSWFGKLGGVERTIEYNRLGERKQDRWLDNHTIYYKTNMGQVRATFMPSIDDQGAGHFVYAVDKTRELISGELREFNVIGEPPVRIIMLDNGRIVNGVVFFGHADPEIIGFLQILGKDGDHLRWEDIIQDIGENPTLDELLEKDPERRRVIWDSENGFVE